MSMAAITYSLICGMCGTLIVTKNTNHSICTTNTNQPICDSCLSNLQAQKDLEAKEYGFGKIRAELKKARALYPNFHSAHEGYAVIKEELDKVWDCVKKNNVPGARIEAIQVAAMAIRFYLDLEGK